MNILIEHVITLINTQAILNNIRIEIVNDCPNILIKCNKNQLKQVFINFLKNSIEAIENGGLITIEIYQYNRNQIKILFKDTGIGIPPDLLKRIGKPFFTTKEKGTIIEVILPIT